MNNNYKIAFFGGEPLGVPVLEILKSASITPALIVASPDRPSGRNLVLTPPPVKVWAAANNIEVFQPATLKDKEPLGRLIDTDWDLFVVVAYNHILPEWLIELPRRKTINLHPSLLPYLRGPSPIRTAILEDKRDAIGVTIILLDKEMDHGPILAQKTLAIKDEEWPLDGMELDKRLIELGGDLLVNTIPLWLQSKIEPRAQDHILATYTKKFSKSQGELLIDPRKIPTGSEAYKMYLTICALSGIGGTFFFHNGKRVKITGARLVNDSLEIESVIPEGKNETTFQNWLNSI